MTKRPDPNVKNVFMSIRLTEELREQIKEKAAQNQRTVAGQVLHYINRCLEQDGAKKP